MQDFVGFFFRFLVMNACPYMDWIIAHAVVHLTSIPPVLRWLQYFSILKYCLEALAINEINSGLMIQDTLQGVPVNVSAVVIMKLVRHLFEG